MKLHYHQNKDGIRNFGDDLNPWLWSRVFSTELDQDEHTMFLGIGTLLNDRLPPAAARVVFGTGVGIGGPPLIDDSWTLYAVRGPFSAAALGISAELAVTDPAILVSHFAAEVSATGPHFRFSYMPHYRSACDSWRQACDRIGFGYIDPRQSVEEVLRAVLSTDVLLAEAMHGAIIADTLRVPWIPIRSRDKILRFKWDDWCASMKLDYRPQTTLGLREGATVLGRTRTAAKGMLASAQLLKAARSRTHLSKEAVFLERRERFDALLRRFRDDVRRGRFTSRGSLHDPAVLAQAGTTKGR
jgi:succinoglycan biosynthesis protein ExoV